MKRTLVALIVAIGFILSASAHAKIPGIAVDFDPLNFGNVPVGSPAHRHSLAITNNRDTTILINKVKVGDTTNFSVPVDICTGSSLQKGGWCAVVISFSPSAVRHYITHFKLTIDGTEGNASVIEGNGTGPAVGFFPTSLDFGDQTVGKASNEKTIAVGNIGNVPLTISSIDVTAPFSRVTGNPDDCGSTLEVLQMCHIRVIFTPTAAGPVSGNVTITDDASDSPQTVPLTGTGVTAPQPHASLSRTAIDFGGQLVGTTSAAEDVTLKNTGTLVLNITDIAVSGDFAETDDCGLTLAVDASCTISTTFSPTAAGAATGTVTITDDSSHSPQTIALTGTGVVHSGPKASFSTNAIDFGNVEEGTTSAPQTYTIENIGDEDLVIDDIEMIGDDGAHFAKESDCLTTLKSGQTCQGDVTFSPQDQITYTATVQFDDNTADSPQTIALTGTGTFAPISGTGCSLTAGTAGQLSLAPLALLFAGLALLTRKRH